MELVTRHDVAARIVAEARAWLARHGRPRNPDAPAWRWRRDLAALGDRPGPDDVDRLHGDVGGQPPTYSLCVECQRHVAEAVEVGGDGVRLCGACLLAAFRLIEPA